MGRNSGLMQTTLQFYTKTGISMTDMQDLSQKKTQTEMVYVHNDLPMEGTERGFTTTTPRSAALDNPIGYTQSCRNDGVTGCEGILPDRFKDSSIDKLYSVRFSRSEKQRGLPINSAEERFAPEYVRDMSDVMKVRVQNSTKTIPLVPEIVIDLVSSSSAISHQSQAVNSSDTLHAGLPLNLASYQKKGRTNSDSAIYEADKRKQCPRSSLSSLHGFCGDSSDLSVFRTFTSKDAVVCEEKLDAGCDADLFKGGRDVLVEQESLCSRSQKKPTLPPLPCNYTGLGNFTFAQEKSPKMYWLRRHSDSNVEDEHKRDLHIMDSYALEPLALRSHSASETIPEIQPNSVDVLENIPEQSVSDGGSLFPVEKDPVVHYVSDGKKCQKIKKYILTRYQNQSLDADDVFMDCVTDDTYSKPEKMQEEETPSASQTLPKPETRDDDIHYSEKELSKSVSRKSLRSPGLMNFSKHVPFDDEEPQNMCKTMTDEDSQKMQQESNDKKSVILESGSPDVSFINSRQFFEFQLASQYSILHDLHDLPRSSGNVVFGVFPHGCLPRPFLPCPLRLEGYNLKSPPSPGILGSPLHGPRDYTINNAAFVAESNRWQSGRWESLGSPKRSAECEPSARPNTERGQPIGMNHLEVQDPTSMESSPTNLTYYQTLDDNSKSISLASLTSSPTLVSRNTLLHSSSSPLPSSPVTCTPTKSSPQVVFDYQFSERIHEQKQASDNSNFVCPVCGNIFLSYNSLANHVVTHLPSEVITQEGSDSSKVHLCKVCNRSFSRSDMLSRHMRLHTGLRPYECHLCQQVFSRSDHLHTHLRTHTGEKPYKCSQCMYAAPRRDMVTRHMRIHMRGGTRRGRRSSSTSSLASEICQTSDDNVSENSTGPTLGLKFSSEGRHKKASPFHKQRNWSVTSSENNDGPDGGFGDKDLSKMTRTESMTSVDSGVSYLTPRSLPPSLWSPGIDSPDVFSRHHGHFLWPTSSPELKYELDKGSPGCAAKDMDSEMHVSFQKCKVTSPLTQPTSQLTDDVEGHIRSENP